MEQCELTEACVHTGSGWYVMNGHVRRSLQKHRPHRTDLGDGECENGAPPLRSSVKFGSVGCSRNTHNKYAHHPHTLHVQIKKLEFSRIITISHKIGMSCKNQLCS